MKKPSKVFRKAIAHALGEQEYLLSISRDLEMAEEVRRGMESKFGAALYDAFEDIERSCYGGLASTSPFNIPAQMKLRVELSIVQYVKAKLDSYVANADTLLQNIEELHGADIND